MQFWDNEALLVRRTIREPSDLNGKTIATPAGSTSHYQLLYFLQMLHLSNTVTVLLAQPSELTELWRAGEIDGAFVWAPHLHALRAAFDTRFLVLGSALARLAAPTATLYIVLNFASHVIIRLKCCNAFTGTCFDATVYPSRLYEMYLELCGHVLMTSIGTPGE